MKFATCADIHIRSLTRHDEIKLAFESFMEGIKNEGIEHVFMGGDLWHNKLSGITAEYIELLTWVFRSLSSLAMVHVILGNHDLNEKNKKRQDAITPIVDAINDPRVKLYKDSGTYNIVPGYNLCVFSIFDPENWDKVEPIDGDVNIACYHGSVMGARTEQDWELLGGVPLDMFSGYTCVWLGDIHKMQVLDSVERVIEIDEDELADYDIVEIVEE